MVLFYFYRETFARFEETCACRDKETAYTSMVRPSVEFASCVWDPHERVDVTKIDMVQRRGERCVKHRYHNRSSVTMMYEIVNKQVAIDPDKHLLNPSTG